MLQIQTEETCYTVSSTELLMTKGETPDDIIQGYISRGLNLVAGPPKSMKTTFSFQAAEHLCKQGQQVLVITPDEGLIGSRQKCINMKIDACCNAIFLDTTNYPILSIEILKNIIEKNPNIRAVVIDTLHSAFPGKFNGNYANQIENMKKLSCFCEKWNVSIIAVMHTTKGTNKKPDKPNFSGLYGTHAMTGSVVNTLIMAKDTDKDRILVHRQGRFCADMTHSLRYNAETGRLECDEPDIADLLDGNLKKVYTALQNNEGPVQLSDIANFVDMQVNYVSSILIKMTERRLVRKVSRGVYELIHSQKPTAPLSEFLAKQTQAAAIDENEIAGENGENNPNQPVGGEEGKIIGETLSDGDFCEMYENADISFEKTNSYEFSEFQQFGEIVNLSVVSEKTVFEQVAVEWCYDGE